MLLRKLRESFPGMAEEEIQNNGCPERSLEHGILGTYHL